MPMPMFNLNRPSPSKTAATAADAKRSKERKAGREAMFAAMRESQARPSGKVEKPKKD